MTNKRLLAGLTNLATTHPQYRTHLAPLLRTASGERWVDVWQQATNNWVLATILPQVVARLKRLGFAINQSNLSLETFVTRTDVSEVMRRPHKTQVRFTIGWPGQILGVDVLSKGANTRSLITFSLIGKSSSAVATPSKIADAVVRTLQTWMEEENVAPSVR